MYCYQSVFYTDFCFQPLFCSESLQQMDSWRGAGHRAASPRQGRTESWHRGARIPVFEVVSIIQSIWRRAALAWCTPSLPTFRVPQQEDQGVTGAGADLRLPSEARFAAVVDVAVATVVASSRGCHCSCKWSYSCSCISWLRVCLCSRLVMDGYWLVVGGWCLVVVVCCGVCCGVLWCAVL